MAYVIGDYNRKGGVGKTSSIINIACQMALQGKRVLLIDGDSQMNLSQFFFEEDDAIFNPDTGKIREGVDTLYETLVEDLNIFNVIQTKEYSARRKWKNKFKKIGLKIDVVLGSSDMDYYGPDENGEKTGVTILATMNGDGLKSRTCVDSSTSDEVTFEYIKGREHAPKGVDWDKAVSHWKERDSRSRCDMGERTLQCTGM